MPVPSLNESIDYVEVLPTPEPAVPLFESTTERVEQQLEEIDALWELLPLHDRIETPEPSYHVPDDLKVSIVIPVYNEKATILELLARVKALPLNSEIIVVDDGSDDGTRGWLETLKGATGLRLIFKERNEGKGAALKTGFAAATGDIVVVQDADLEYDPKDILTLIEPLVGGHADVAFGSRFMENARPSGSVFHRAANRVLTRLSNQFTGLHLTDMETCYKAFRRGVLRGITLQQNRFGFEPEVTAKVARRRYRIIETPISYSARSYAAGKKIGLRDALNALYCIVRYGSAD